MKKATRKDEQKVIREFAKAMQIKLDLRSKKGRMEWRKKTIRKLYYLLTEEIDEFNFSYNADECLDVALYAMMIRDVIKQKK